MNDDLQRTEEWHKARLGKFTSSRLKELMTNGRGQHKDSMGLTAIGYVQEVCTEVLTGQAKTFSSVHTDWGMEHEAEAIKFYEDLAECKVLDVGFHPHKDDKLNFGGSPDGLIAKQNGIIEVKCPSNSIKMFNMLRKREVPDDYKWQLQGNMLVTGTDFCDFIMYDPRMIDDSHKMVIIRVYRDEDMIDQLIMRLKMAKVYMTKFLDDIEPLEEL